MRSAMLCLGLLACDPELANAPRVDEASLQRQPCPGSPYGSIQAAIDAAPSGGTVTVCDGTFVERLRVSGKRVTVRSQSGAATTILDANYGGSAVSVTSGGDLTLEGFTVKNGRSSADGGGVYCSGAKVTLKRSRITGNKAVNGGGLSASGCTVSLVDDDLYGNTASVRGGGASFKSGSTGTLSLSAFSDNTAGTQGGGVYVQGSGITLDGNELVANDAQYGGGAYIDGDGAIRNNLVEDNTTTENGAGMFVHYHDGEIAFNAFSGNRSDEDGGGLYVNDGTARVHDNEFLFNDAGDDAGGLRIKLAAPSVDDNYFEGNFAMSEGGGMKMSHDAARSLSGNVFVDNESNWHGGALVLDESASVLSDSTFTGNHSQSGGALYIQLGWDAVTVQYTTFEDNSASRWGGHIYIYKTGQYAVTNLVRDELVGGTAAYGGAIYAEQGDLRLKSTLLRYNSATTAGGALYLRDMTGSITNAIGYANSGPSGAFFATDAARAMTVRNTVLYQNTGGAAVKKIAGSTPVFTYNDLYGNTSRFSGMSDPSYGSGNKLVYPGFVSASGGDFHLSSTSPLINAGDPAIQDRNGTRSDLGIYGGPYGW